MSKEKITSKKELQKALNMIAIDDWFDNPFFETPNISKEEYLKLYDDYILKMKMQILLTEYDICIEDDK